MEKNGILCILIAAALLVTSVAAVSADQTAILEQNASQINSNVITTTAGDNATVAPQTINSINIQTQVGVIVETGDINVVLGNIENSSYTKSSSGSSSGNQVAAISQDASQDNLNLITTTAGDNATVASKTINSINIQTQVGVIAQTDDINFVGGNIENSSYTKFSSGSSSKDTTAMIDQTGPQMNTNLLPTSATANAIVAPKTINSINSQAQIDGIVQTDDVNVVLGDIEDSAYSKKDIPAPPSKGG